MVHNRQNYSKKLKFSDAKNTTVIILGRASGANLLPVALKNVTYGPKWPVKILDGAKFYPDCSEIKNMIFQFLIQACCKKLFGVNQGSI